MKISKTHHRTKKGVMKKNPKMYKIKKESSHYIIVNNRGREVIRYQFGSIFQAESTVKFLNDLMDRVSRKQKVVDSRYDDDVIDIIENYKLIDEETMETLRYPSGDDDYEMSSTEIMEGIEEAEFIDKKILNALEGGY